MNTDHTHVEADYDQFIMFYTNWCPECDTLAAQLSQYATDIKSISTFKMYRLSTDWNDLKELTIEAVPRFMLFKKGKKSEPLEWSESMKFADIVTWLQINSVELEKGIRERSDL